MACTQPYWSSLQVGSQHLARQFAFHDWEVHYLSSPVTLFHLLKFRSYEARKRFCHSLNRPIHHCNNMITSYIPFSAITPLPLPFLRSDFIIENWYKTILTPVKNKIENIQEKRFDLLYIDNIFYHFLLSSINFSKSIFRVMDIHSAFHGWNKNVKTVAKKIAQNTSLTIYSAKGLQEYVQHLEAKKAFLIPNGVDLRFFHNEIKYKKGEKHSALKNIPTPIVLYVGMIDSRIDFELIKKVARKIPGISFVFIGPFAEGVQPKDLPVNIYLLGPVSHKEVPLIMSSAKVGLIPFNTKKQMHRIKGIRPLKLFEYFAAGIPVISSRWPEIEELNSPVWIYDDEKSFIDLLKHASRNVFDPQPFHSFSREHSWESKFDLLMKKMTSTSELSK